MGRISILMSCLLGLCTVQVMWGEDPNGLEALTTDATGITTLRLAPLLKTLEPLGPRLGTLGGARLLSPDERTATSSVTVPVTGGVFAIQQGAEFVHTGGLSLEVGRTRVLLSNLVLSITSSPEPGTLSAQVIVDGEFRGRWPLFEVSAVNEFVYSTPLSSNRIGQAWSVDGVVFSLTDSGARVLNEALTTDLLRAGTPVGEARIVLSVEGNEDTVLRPTAERSAVETPRRLRRSASKAGPVPSVMEQFRKSPR